MSYQARMTAPALIVTGWKGACGNTKRVGCEEGRARAGTMGSKSWPSAPSPCSQMTAARGSVPVSTSTVSSSELIVGPACRRASRDQALHQVLHEPVEAGLVDPAHDGDEVVLGVDPDDVA